MVGVVEARYVKDDVVWLRFSDGLEGELDLRDELYGEVFEPLKDPAVFRSFSVQPEWRTIAWPNGADLAPEFLYEAVKAGEHAAALRPRSRGRSDDRKWSKEALGSSARR